VGELLHMMRWSRPEIYNAVRDLSRYMTTGTTHEHVKAMERVMIYCLTTRDRGLELQPDAEWNGNPEFNLRILGRSDSDYAKDVETRKSVSGTSTFLCGTPISQSSLSQEESVRGDVILCCDTPGNVQKVLSQKAVSCKGLCLFSIGLQDKVDGILKQFRTAI